VRAERRCGNEEGCERYEGPEPGGTGWRDMGGDVEEGAGAVNMKVRVWVLDVDVEAVVLQVSTKSFFSVVCWEGVKIII
jgi:hypothetical protein